MFTSSMIRSIVATAVVGLTLSVSAGPAAAGEVCDPKKTNCPPVCDPKKENCEPVCDPKKENCEPVCDPKTEICDVCHNIGGPRALGANCDAGNCTLADMVATGNADLIAAFAQALVVCSQHDCDPEDIYGGIVVPYADAAYTAHYNHGDGLTLVTFDRVHETQPHVAANVGCFAVRHDPDPGN
jgi:hypothetical protein